MTITPYPQTEITELRRALNEFSEPPKTPAAKTASPATLSDILKNIATPDPQPQAEYSALLKTALSQTSMLLRDYTREQNIAEECDGPASTLCVELRALKTAGTRADTKDFIRVGRTLENFLQKLAEKYPACMRDGRHPITNTMEKVNHFIRQQVNTDMDVIIGGARIAIEQVIKSRAKVFAVYEHNLPLDDSDYGFLARAASALQESQKYMEKTLQECAEDTQPGRNRLIEALPQLPTKTLQEHAALTPDSTQATVGNLILEVKKSVDAIRELSPSKANDVLYNRCHKAVENAFKPPSALEI